MQLKSVTGNFTFYPPKRLRLSENKALIFYRKHKYDVFFGLAHALANGLRSFNWAVDLIDMNSNVGIVYSITQRKKYSKIFFTGCPPLRKRIFGNLLSEYFGGDLYYWVLDPIIHDLLHNKEVYSFLNKSATENRYKICFPDKSYKSVVDTAFNSTTIYLPFAGFFGQQESNSQRMRRAVIVGTIGNELNQQKHNSLYDVISSSNHFKFSEKRIRNLVEKIQSPQAKNNISTEFIESENIDPNDVLNSGGLELLARIDAFEKRRRRIAVVNSLEGIPIDFYGDGWNRYFSDRENSRFLGNIRYDQLSAISLKYPVLINFDPNWDDGLHDRAFTAVGNGCRVVSNFNLAFKEFEFPEESYYCFAANKPVIKEVVENWISSDPIDPILTQRFRIINSWFARIEAFFTQECMKPKTPENIYPSEL